MRGQLLVALAWLAWLLPALAFDPVVPGGPLQFPRDAGAHPGHRIEWWYVTGHLRDEDGALLGFQVTFFRVRNKEAESLEGRFSPRQLLFAHATLADPRRGRLLHDQRSARMVPGLVEAATANTDVRLDDWRLVREPDAYRAHVRSEAFAFDLSLAPTQPVLLHGEGGLSRKGPLPRHASFYYSEPHLRVQGTVAYEGTRRAVEGIAWLDHEWASDPLPEAATGWDWLGANLDDGSALMVGRTRALDGSALWAAATFRPSQGAARTFPPEAVEFLPRRLWRSPRTGVAYPVAFEIRVGQRTWHIEPLMDDQEIDARQSTGTLYWEGAVRVRSDDGRTGRGYLELTGYAERVPF